MPDTDTPAPHGRLSDAHYADITSALVAAHVIEPPVAEHLRDLAADPAADFFYGQFGGDSEAQPLTEAGARWIVDLPADAVAALGAIRGSRLGIFHLWLPKGGERFFAAIHAAGMRSTQERRAA